MADHLDARIDRDVARADHRAADLQDRREAEKTDDQQQDQREGAPRAPAQPFRDIVALGLEEVPGGERVHRRQLRWDRTVTLPPLRGAGAGLAICASTSSRGPNARIAPPWISSARSTVARTARRCATSRTMPPRALTPCTSRARGTSPSGSRVELGSSSPTTNR